MPRQNSPGNAVGLAHMFRVSLDGNKYVVYVWEYESTKTSVKMSVTLQWFITGGGVTSQTMLAPRHAIDELGGIQEFVVKVLLSEGEVKAW